MVRRAVMRCMLGTVWVTMLLAGAGCSGDGDCNQAFVVCSANRLLLCRAPGDYVETDCGARGLVCSEAEAACVAGTAGSPTASSAASTVSSSVSTTGTTVSSSVGSSGGAGGAGGAGQ